MVNIEDFIKRLETVLEYYSLTASSFADKISVQRSSMSHLLSGRNKPSLDFIMKLAEEFPEVTLEWILNGKGSFPKDDFTPAPTFIQPEKKIEQPTKEDLFSNKLEEKNNLLEANKATQISTPENQIRNQNTIQTESEIERIVVFFKNGTFKNYIH
ncbi:helix-turn-helix transcriptional regulator [Flavobacterium gelidilacus]|uniref:helix-turn-helix transcriptional regulator n=1 Tax=Flavobacterium gelidilacus TaxID=206041 RepID=UPI0003FAFFD4|nr:helix-turn-helix transcriptional regulator [Flavobacterium gelidilacus]